MIDNPKRLSERKKVILKAIVDVHISNNGEPVGSKYLTGNKQLALSSATIRNEMAELEEMGYLEQPHASAGRVPSQKGYRFYVDSLMNHYRLTAEEIFELNRLIHSKISELDTILLKASQLVSRLTNYTTLAVKPKKDQIVLSHFTAVYISAFRFVFIFVTKENHVKTRNITTELPITSEALMRLCEGMNHSFSGISVHEITLPMLMELERKMGTYSFLVDLVVKSIYEAITEIHQGEMQFEGIERMLSYPEYADHNKLKEMIGLLEQKDEILSIISEEDLQNTVVKIGAENPIDVMNNSSLVFKKIQSGEKTVGIVGVIGPCRMDYSKVVALLDYMSKQFLDVHGMENKLSMPDDFTERNKDK